MPLIGLLLAIGVSLLWYYPVVKAMGETKAAKKEWCLAVLLPFFLHGCWDSGLYLALFGIEQEAAAPAVAAKEGEVL